MMIDRDIVRFCSIECRLQMSGELSVGWMVDAWLYAKEISSVMNWEDDEKPIYQYIPPTVTDVLNLGKLVEPNVNALGFRTCGVQVGSDVKMDWRLVPQQVVNLMENQEALTPNEFFKEYEEIHPFLTEMGERG